jgi:hypothetical protein
MIRKSGHRIFEKIMLKQKNRAWMTFRRRVIQALSNPRHGSRRGLLGLPEIPGRWVCQMLPKPNAPPSGRTRNPRIDQFDPCILKSGNQFHERIDVGPDNAVAGFHALNGRNRKIRQIGGLSLVYIQERAGGPELIGRDHEMAAPGSIGIRIYLHHPNYRFKHEFRCKIYQCWVDAKLLRYCLP